jgi:hypothetical protein
MIFGDFRRRFEGELTPILLSWSLGGLAKVALRGFASRSNSSIFKLS